MKNNWPLIRNKYIWKEINTPNEDENANLLSVSQYSGIKPKAELIEDGDFLSRASTLKGYKCVEKGDLVINTMLAWNGSLGVSDYNGVVSPSYNVYRLIDPENWDTVFLHYYLRSEHSKVEFRRFSTGIIESRLRLYPEQFLNLRTPKIPIKTQRKIGEILKQKESQIEIIKEKLKTKIQLMREYRSSLITQAVTKGLDPNVPMKDSGIEWLGEVPEHWTVQRIKNICSINGRIGFRGYSSEDIVGEKEGAITFSPSNIKDQCLSLDNLTYLSWEKYYESPEIQIKNNDIIFCKTGSIGKVALIDGLEEAATINPQLIIFTDIKLMTKYFYYSLVSNLIQNQVRLFAGGGVMPTLTQETISNFKIFVPPLKEQAKIIEFLDKLTNDVNEVIKKAESQIMLLDTYRSSLITAAVTGQIDVSDWKEAEEELETIS
ncbi:restriction endonuclease subunit S [Anoxybacillus flavithermus]|uniref:restriction endonuclease subunit S n=1 Tax=Anoxybacillus flavithermus TaxID=33934 RepID=UPI0018685A43|nr:restriction endonuclease subunit S [Anoxybacillus flavithermus]MBE2941063.1 restriction endonuclease subunit S [Anoxybacillus flavithermus]MBE2943751.1 restriction endonuclease subunit S [Anoxybacillus flavithermus]MBE2952009.1 restriction endonuclease subunit S [Anoxybacillus flavithermus]MBE2954602.1 restriction endonuclease subunit S [Anoxybacillus flavithermus]MBE2960000.1 restriction endonuclease subunit S [Anoxybacillus flavithermus]